MLQEARQVPDHAWQMQTTREWTTEHDGSSGSRRGRSSETLNSPWSSAGDAGASSGSDELGFEGSQRVKGFGLPDIGTWNTVRWKEADYTQWGQDVEVPKGTEAGFGLRFFLTLHLHLGGLGTR